MINLYPNTKNTFLYLLILVIPAQITLAQEQFQQTQFIHSAFAINPAFTGVEDIVNAHTGVKKIWAGLDDSPTLYFAGIQGTVSGYQNSISEKRTLRRSVPRYFNKLKNQKSSFHHGLGSYISYHQQGAFNKLSAYFSYAFIYNISDRYKLSFGGGTQLSHQKFRDDYITVNDPDADEVYLNYLNGAGDVWGINLNGGVMLYGQSLFVGYSVHQPVKITSTGDDQTIDPGLFHYLMAGYNFQFNESITFQPSLLLQYNQIYDMSKHVMAKMKYRNVFWIGGGYRFDDAISALVGFQSDYGIHISYSYEYHTKNIGAQSNGSHELIIGIRMFQDKVSTPFLW